jgi:hypothetical protein
LFEVRQVADREAAPAFQVTGLAADDLLGDRVNVGGFVVVRHEESPSAEKG